MISLIIIQFVLITIIIARVFNDDKIVGRRLDELTDRLDQLAGRIDKFGEDFQRFRIRETSALVIAEQNRLQLEKIEKLVTKTNTDTLPLPQDQTEIIRYDLDES